MGLSMPGSTESLIEAVESPLDADGPGNDACTLEELMAVFGVPGVSVAVVQDYEIHWAKAYGIADVATGMPVNTETLFQAASISKPVSAMAALKATQDGRFSLDEDINSVLESWQLPHTAFTKDRPVTPRMLLSHTAGLGDGFGFPGYEPTDGLPTPVQILEGGPPSALGPVLMVSPPMTTSQYSGGGAVMMQLALADSVGKPFSEIVQREVLDPVGMSESTFEQPLSSRRDANASRGHDDTGRARDAKWHVYPELAAAGLWTTPIDMARFVIEVQKSFRGEANRVLSEATVKEMLTPVGIGSYAVGFEMVNRSDGWYFTHGGSNWGFQALLMAHKESGYGFVVMTNGDRGDFVLNEVQKRIERAYGYEPSQI